MVRGGPVAVAIEQSADDPAVEDSGKSVVIRLGSPIGDHKPIGLRDTPDPQTLWVGRAATETDALRRKPLLE